MSSTSTQSTTVHDTPSRQDTPRQDTSGTVLFSSDYTFDQDTLSDEAPQILVKQRKCKIQSCENYTYYGCPPCHFG